MPDPAAVAQEIVSILAVGDRVDQSDITALIGDITTALQAAQQQGKLENWQAHVCGAHPGQHLVACLDCLQAAKQEELDAVIRFLATWEYYGDCEDGKRLAEWLHAGKHRPVPAPGGEG